VSKCLKIALIATVLLLDVLGILFFVVRLQVVRLTRHPIGDREPMEQTLLGCGVHCEEVTVTTRDGLRLVGWYVPSQNGAVIIAQHGYWGDRGDLVATAKLLQRHGYGVLVSTVRAHDQSEGELITLGKEEMKDLDAWYRYLSKKDGVDRDRIGILGESMGGALAIKYAARNPNIKAVVTHSTFVSLHEVLEREVQRLVGLPPFPLVPMLGYWIEHEVGIETSEIDPTDWIKELSPRPVFILHGGRDIHLRPDVGDRLYQAAGEPKELWYEEEALHHGFEEEPFEAEFEQRLVGFFDRYLLIDSGGATTAKTAQDNGG
jgi:fermentation-respiration switch protein FrsA (DUF1100 family)